MPEPGVAVQRVSDARFSRGGVLASLLAVAAPGGRRARLSILIYHRVHAAPDPLFPTQSTAASFRTRMQWVRETFNVLPLTDAVQRLARGTLPPRALAVTFDDGYADNATVALPILREVGVPATFFVSTGFLDGGRMWNDTVIEAVRAARGASLDATALGLDRYAIGTVAERRATIAALLGALKYRIPTERQAAVDALALLVGAPLPDDLMMTSDQVRALAAAGMEIGGHTVHHPILARLPEDEARREIADGRDALEAIVRQPVRVFAYPNGKPGVDYEPTHARLVQSLGFVAAVTTGGGAARPWTSPFELPRFTPWDRTRLRFCARLARNARREPTLAPAA